MRIPLKKKTSWTIARHLNHQKITTVLDVGANKGIFTQRLFDDGFTGRVISFEPLKSAHAELCNRVREFKAWEVAERAAIGFGSGSVVINVSENSVSSSILPLAPLSQEIAPATRYISTEEVPIRTLSEASRSYLSKSDRVFVKIDAQGYEREIIDGCADIIKLIQGFRVEMSITELYEGQELMAENSARIEALGFQLYDLAAASRDPRSGRVLQYHGLFFRQ